MSWQDYLTQVLGVEKILIPSSEVLAQAKETQLDNCKILFLSEPASPSLLDLEIFQRMLIAMKLEFGEFAVWEISKMDLTRLEIQIPNQIVIVSFSEELTHELAQLRTKLHIQTLTHPRICLEQPAYKKEVWEGLKLALSHAGLSHRL